jgi:twitching motility protein PilT
LNTALNSLLATTRHHGASDLHVKAGSAPRVRIRGELQPLAQNIYSAEEVMEMLESVMPAERLVTYKNTGEGDFAIADPERGRFRVNAYMQRGLPAFVARAVGAHPSTLEELGLPVDTLTQMAMQPRGLILVTGPTGSGKSSTLAAMIDVINQRRAVHIVTVEDPIETLHSDKMASISQRELGIDTESFRAALKAAMREDPDVIQIGEMRDRDTVRAALEASETGHLVMSTLHTSTVVDTVARILDFYPGDEQPQIRAALAGAIKGVLCQRLVPTSDGQGRVVAMEIAVASGSVIEAIADPDKTDQIPEILERSRQYGMQTFDTHLLRLVMADKISIEDAMSVATHAGDFSVALRKQGLSDRVAG